MSDSENNYSEKEKKEINEKLFDLVGNKHPEKVRKGPSIFKYIAGFILNWIKLPFQLSYFQDVTGMDFVGTIPKFKNPNMQNLVVKPDQTFAYYSDNTTTDGHSHDTDNQFVNHAMYLYINGNSLDETTFRAAMKFVYTSIHGGLNLTNGVSWSHGISHYHSNNVSTETLALMALMAPGNDSLRTNFEKLMLNMVDNGGYLNLLSNPGGSKQKAYEQALAIAEFDVTRVKMENPATNIFPGSATNDASVVALAALAVAIKSSSSKRLTGLFKLYYYLFGYGLKARFCSNSLEAITGLYVLAKVTKEKKYENILKKKLGPGKLDDLFKSFLYGKLVK